MITFAVSFIAAGDVDLQRASVLFVISAISALAITVFLVLQKHPLNPILIGTDIWLSIGAAAFGVGFPALASLIDGTRAAGLFACTAGVGLVLTFTSPSGYIGARHPDRGLVLTLSFVLLALTLAALVWSWFNVENIRIGGGLPFILLNIARRVLIKRFLVST